MLNFSSKSYLTLRLLIVAILLVFICLSLLSGVVFAHEVPSKVAVIMYHNTVPDFLPSSKYVVTESELDKDFAYLKDNGYTVLSLKTLLECAKANTPLPKKSVLLTFDDGYWYNMTIGIPLLQKYGYTAVFAIVGEFTSLNKNNPNCSKAYTYLDFNDVKECSESGAVEIAYHSYYLHHISSKCNGAAIKKGETPTAYKERFLNDTSLLSSAFDKIGVKPLCYTYPYGAYCAQSEEALTDINIPFSMTCVEGITTVKGLKDLRLMKRINRIGNKACYLAQTLKEYGY